MTRRIRTVLFDMDGVLVDSFEAWYAVVNHTAAHFGAPAIDRARLAAAFGQGPEDDAKTLYPGRTPAEIRAVYDEVMPGEVARVEVGPDSRRVLDDLGRRGVRRAVVTNTQVSLARRILEGAVREGDQVRVEYDGGEFTFTTESAPEGVLNHG